MQPHRSIRISWRATAAGESAKRQLPLQRCSPDCFASMARRTQRPLKHTVRARHACSSLMHGVILLVAGACATERVRAGATANETCAAEAASVFAAILTRAGVVDIAGAIEAGCEDADALSFCAVRGSAGPCSANPACPANHISSFGCMDNEDAACCIEHLQKPCEGCEPTVTECLSLCGGPAPPALDPVEDRFERATARAQEICSTRADEILPTSALAFPHLFTVASCDHADTLVTCELLGAFGACSDITLCDDVDIINTNCTAHSTAHSCCTIYLAPLCQGCEPSVEFCRQQCLETPPFPTSQPAAPGMPPIETSAAFACASSAAAILEGLALMNSESFAAGCDDSDPLSRCDIQTSVGSCASNPVCPADQIDPGRCTSATGPPSCCAVMRARPCRGCDPVPVQCHDICTSDVDSSGPTVFVEERLHKECIAAADISLAALRAEDADFIAANCETADPGQACGVAGTSGPCHATEACRSLDVQIGESCMAPLAKEDDSCCLATVAPPCRGCPPEPLECVQTCF